MSETGAPAGTRREQLQALLSAAKFNPGFTAALVVLGLGVAILEGIGLTFIIPIIEIIQAEDPVAEAEGLSLVFVTFYQTLGVPFTLGYAVVGVTLVMTLRYTSSFVYNWLRKRLRFEYQRHLQKRAFDNALGAEMSYFDTEGSDEILNTIITESATAARVINKVVKILNFSFLTAVYLLITLWISPFLTVISVAILGAITVLLQNVFESGYDLGDKIADANERRQEAAQAGMIGIRDIRVFNLSDEMAAQFERAVDQYTTNKIRIMRNQTAISQFYNLAVAVFVFVLIYLALRYASLTFGELGLFLFAMFQLGPKVSALNELAYTVVNELPHLVRTQQFLSNLAARQEPTGGSRAVPDPVERVSFEDVSFSYTDDEQVLRDISFGVEKGEFVAFVGQSGAGKSTIVSLLARYYQPDTGEIYANDAPISEMAPDEWRERLAVVRQSPYIFNDTLRYNLTLGNREASETELDRACAIARVDEFLEDLPDGYDSELGDEGVRLSGGQKQRLALARALLKDADLLVLDEATSDLDTNLEQEVQRAIEEMDHEYGIITIAHRLSTVKNADRIYTMRDGQISERGNHSDLVDNGGTYAELYSVQHS